MRFARSFPSRRKAHRSCALLPPQWLRSVSAISAAVASLRSWSSTPSWRRPRAPNLLRGPKRHARLRGCLRRHLQFRRALFFRARSLQENRLQRRGHRRKTPSARASTVRVSPASSRSDLRRRASKRRRPSSPRSGESSIHSVFPSFPRTRPWCVRTIGRASRYSERIGFPRLRLCKNNGCCASSAGAATRFGEG